MTLTPRSLLIFVGMLIPAAAAVLVYADFVNHEFLHWDDYPYVVENDQIQSLNLQNLKWAFFEHYFLNWHPLTWLVYMLEYRLWGENTTLFKLVNICFHILNSYLIVLLARKIIDILYPISPGAAKYDDQSRWVAGFFAGTLFAVHPLHVESVVWISELKDVLSGLFYFVALIAYINYRQSGLNTRWRNLLGLAFLCALMSKSMAVTLPAALLVMDIFLFNRLVRTSWLPSLLRLIREKLMYFFISACAAVLTFISQNTEALAATGLLTRLINACESLTLYRGNFFIPLNLSPFYPFSKLSLEPGLHSLIPVMLVAAGVIGLCLVEKRLLKGVVFALVFFLIAILPVIGLIKVGEQAAADRYIYIPMSMFFVAAGCGLYRLLDVFSRRPGIRGSSLAMASILLAAYAWQTVIYVPIWQTDEKLWTYVNHRYPMQVAAAYLNLGNLEYGKGNNEAALRLYETALVIDGNYINALGNRAAVNENLGNHEYAADLYQGLADVNGDSLQALNIAAAGMRRVGRLGLSAKYCQRTKLIDPPVGQYF